MKAAANTKAAGNKVAANTKAAANKATEKERLLAVLKTNKLGMFNRRRITQLKNNADLQNALSEFNAKMKAAANTKAAGNKAAANTRAAANAEKKARNALKNYLVATVKPRYNKALVNSILKLPELNNNTRRRLQSPKMYALQRGAGVLGRGAVTAGSALGRGAVTVGDALGRGAVTAGGAAYAEARVKYNKFMRPKIEKLEEIVTNPLSRRGDRENAIRELSSISKDPKTSMQNIARIKTFLVNKNNNLNAILKGQKAPGFFNRIFTRTKPPNAKPPNTMPPNAKPPNAKPPNEPPNAKPPNEPPNTKARNEPPNTIPTGVSVGVGPNRYGNGNRYGGGGRGQSGGIIFRPQITVGAARIGAQTFGGTRVGGQTMGSSRATTGNVSGSRITTGNTGSTTLKTGNAGNSRLAVSAPRPNGNRQLAATSEQLIRGAGGAEAVEQGIKALNAANGNVARAKAASKLPNNTFTNIYAMGGPVAAKKLVQQRRRRRTVASKKKRVVRKPKKQYIKLTPYQFKRLTDHIKKNNLRKVLIKEITH